MSVKKPLSTDRQYPLVAYAEADFELLPTGEAVAVVRVQANGVVVRGGVIVTEAWDSGTSDVLDVGDADDADRYTASAIDLQAAGHTALDVTGDMYVEETDVIFTVTSAGAAATAGKMKAYVEYIVVGRSNENG